MPDVFTLAITVVVVLLLCLVVPAHAQSEVFTVREVTVDARARTASEARTQGLQRGQIDALNMLFRRLVPRPFHAELPQLAPRDAIDLVQDFSVANERSSAVRYLADLTVRFHPESVRSTLRFANVPFAETVGKPVVIVPLFQASVVTDPILWEDPNPWRDAWYHLPKADGLVPRQLPFADLQDLTTLRVGDAIVRDRDVLQGWASRYGADHVVIVTASLVGSLGAESVRATLYFTRAGKEQRIDVPATGGQTWADLFVAAATEAWAVIEDDWKKENMLQFGVTGQITALVPLTGLEDWLTVKNRLNRVPLIDRYELQAMTRDRAQITLYYLGDEDQLELAMAQTNLALVWQDEAWVIEDRAQGSSEPPTLRGAIPATPIPTSPNGGVPRFNGPQSPPSVYPSDLFGNSQSSRRP